MITTKFCTCPGECHEMCKIVTWSDHSLLGKPKLLLQDLDHKLIAIVGNDPTTFDHNDVLLQILHFYPDFAAVVTVHWSSSIKIKMFSLQWHYNEHNGIWNRRCLDCLLNHLFRCRSKKTSKLRVTGLCEGNSTVTGEFPAQRASNAENVSI